MSWGILATYPNHAPEWMTKNVDGHEVPRLFDRQAEAADHLSAVLDRAELSPIGEAKLWSYEVKEYEPPPAPKGKGHLRVVSIARKPWDAMVKGIETQLEHAKRGEVAAFAYVVEYDDGSMDFRVWHGENSWPVKLIGEIEMLKACVVQKNAERIARDSDEEDPG